MNYCVNNNFRIIHLCHLLRKVRIERLIDLICTDKLSKNRNKSLVKIYKKLSGLRQKDCKQVG